MHVICLKNEEKSEVTTKDLELFKDFRNYELYQKHLYRSIRKGSFEKTNAYHVLT